MVQLIVGNKKICFNLNTPEKEKELFNTWYAMSDMPAYLTKRVKITTDKNEHLFYTIGEISDCLYIDKVWVEENTEVSSTNKEETLDDLYSQLFPIELLLTEEMKNLFIKTFSILPVSQVKKLFQFTTEIISSGLPLIRENPVMVELIKDMVHNREGDIFDYAKRYRDSLKNK
jgi:hypothetical protein